MDKVHSEGTEGEYRRPVALPYCRGLSEKCQRIFRTHRVTVYHKPWNTIKQTLVNPKDKIDKFRRCGVVYELQCNDCKSLYISETKRSIKVRFKEHNRQYSPVTAVGEHKRDKGHDFPPKNIKILDSEEQWLRRRVNEALFIKERDPDLNRDCGMDLPPIYDHLVSRDCNISSRGTTSQ